MTLHITSYLFTPLQTPSHPLTPPHTSTPFKPSHTPSNPLTPPHTPSHLYTLQTLSHPLTLLHRTATSTWSWCVPFCWGPSSDISSNTTSTSPWAMSTLDSPTSPPSSPSLLMSPLSAAELTCAWCVCVRVFVCVGVRAYVCVCVCVCVVPTTTTTTVGCDDAGLLVAVDNKLPRNAEAVAGYAGAEGTREAGGRGVSYAAQEAAEETTDRQAASQETPLATTKVLWRLSALCLFVIVIIVVIVICYDCRRFVCYCFYCCYCYLL